MSAKDSTPATLEDFRDEPLDHRRVKLDSWGDFEGAVQRLSQLYIDLDHAATVPLLPILFRGHANSEWKLETTLERYGLRNQKLSDYYKAVRLVQPEIESLTDESWDNLTIPLDGFERDPGLYLGGFFSTNPPDHPATPLLALMTYLRHREFPSPLLDWSRSPFVAAHFALWSVPHPSTQHMSIYAYLEQTGEGKGGAAPMVGTVSTAVRTDPRHFGQQSRYTMCLDDQLILQSHEVGFRDQGDRQDVMWKFEIPASVRHEGLMRLDQFNISRFSLFRSTEALMWSLAARTWGAPGTV